MDELRAAPLSEEDIAEFRRIMKEESGQDLTEGEARLRATELVRLYRLLLAPPAPSAEVRQPIASGEMEAPLVRGLTGLLEELDKVDKRPSEWRWALVSLWTLLRDTLLQCLAEHRAPAEATGSTFVQPPAMDLPRLLGVVQREIKITIPSHTRRAIEQLNRLHAELERMTPGLWGVIAPGLPATFRECLDVISIVDVEKSTGVKHAVDKVVARLLGGVPRG